MSIRRTGAYPLYECVIATASAACVILLCCRVYGTLVINAVSGPLHIQTSGGEEDPLFSIWRFVHNQRVYGDIRSIPYSTSLFNWLFYVSYGSVVKWVLALTNADDIWLPVIGRMFTLIWGLLNTVTIGLIMKELATARVLIRRILPIAIVGGAGPFVGYWLLTVRPDVAAVWAELFGLYLALRYLFTRKLLFLLALLLFLCVAWSFKQTSVSVFIGIWLWLAIRRRFRDLIIVTVVSIVFYFATFVLGGRDYFHHTMLGQMNQGFTLEQGLRNLSVATLKMPFAPIGVAAIPVLWKWHRSEACSLIVIVCLSSLMWGFLTSMKDGASDNYHFVGGTLALLLAHYASEQSVFIRGEGSFFRYAMIAASLLQILGIIMIFCGWRGRLVPDYSMHEKCSRVLSKSASSEPPVIVVADKFPNLPWIQKQSPHFVYGFTYLLDHEHGMEFDQGGIGGLIRQRYFGTIVAWDGQVEFDGARFDGYEPEAAEGNYVFWVRRNNR